MDVQYITHSKGGGGFFSGPVRVWGRQLVGVLKEVDYMGKSIEG